jgi:hypothetical protein
MMLLFITTWRLDLFGFVLLLLPSPPASNPFYYFICVCVCVTYGNEVRASRGHLLHTVGVDGLSAPLGSSSSVKNAPPRLVPMGFVLFLLTVQPHMKPLYNWMMEVSGRDDSMIIIAPTSFCCLISVVFISPPPKSNTFLSQSLMWMCKMYMHEV